MPTGRAIKVHVHESMAASQPLPHTPESPLRDEPSKSRYFGRDGADHATSKPQAIYHGAIALSQARIELAVGACFSGEL